LALTILAVCLYIHIASVQQDTVCRLLRGEEVALANTQRPQQVAEALTTGVAVFLFQQSLKAWCATPLDDLPARRAACRSLLARAFVLLGALLRLANLFDAQA
jgi:hypothetical protein